MPKPLLLASLLAFSTAYSQSPPTISSTNPTFLMIGSEVPCDDEILATVSPDGDDFSPIGNAPAWKPSPNVRCIRDHTLLHYSDKTHKPYWLCAYTTEFQQGSATIADTFGLAKSDDLIHWTPVTPVAPGCFNEKVLHAWSPYLFQDPADGAVYVFVTICTTSGWKGIGSMKCNDPGTWKDWTDWKVFPPLQRNAGEYNGAAAYFLNGRYWFFFDDASRDNGYAAAEAYMVSPTNLFSGYSRPTYIPSLNSTLSIDDKFNHKPAKQYRYEGMSLVWMHGPVWRIYVQEIGKVSGVYINDQMGFVQSDDNMQTWGPYQFVGDAKSNIGDFTAAHVYRIDPDRGVSP